MSHTSIFSGRRGWRPADSRQRLPVRRLDVGTEVELAEIFAAAIAEAAAEVQRVVVPDALIGFAGIDRRVAQIRPVGLVGVVTWAAGAFLAVPAASGLGEDVDTVTTLAGPGVEAAGDGPIRAVLQPSVTARGRARAPAVVDRAIGHPRMTEDGLIQIDRGPQLGPEKIRP